MSAAELSNLGRSHLSHGEPHEALKYFEKAVQRVEADDKASAVGAFMGIGRAHDGMKNFSLATQAYSVARDLAIDLDDEDLLVPATVAFRNSISKAGSNRGCSGVGAHRPAKWA